MLCNYCGTQTGDDYQICLDCSPAIITNKHSKRKYFSTQCKRDTLEDQNHRCDNCGGKFTRNNRVQYHHDDEEPENNDCDNCVALHAGCHDAITRDSHKRGNNDDDAPDDDDDAPDDEAGWGKSMLSDLDKWSRIG